MKNLSVMVKPASSLCNMRCQYCFYKEVSDKREVSSYGLMTNETVKSMLDHIYQDLEGGDQITFAFQGGEPTLSGLPYFKNFIDCVRGWNKEIQVKYALQTNGILIDDAWCEFLKNNNFLVGISFDILEELNDEARQNIDGSGTSKRVLHTIELFQKYQIDFNVLCTLTSKIAKQPKLVWEKIVQLDIKYVQFTPCIGEVEDMNSGEYSLSPQLFAEFYIGIFSMWLDDFRKNEYRSVKLIDDLFNLFAYGAITSCGINGVCQPQIIVEADGSVYPCDFYCLDQFRLGSFHELSIKELYERSFLFANKKNNKLESICRDCTFVKICSGGCKRMRENICFRKGEEYCGFKTVLTSCTPDILTIIEQQFLA